ncbi:hypothetical protein EST38_g12424 [Candolleomyces aberdarensis]|uniref:DUF5648 domain-containing protein n=1 Tax=Candolleomyces aberdarensis TaxID=2316362 RepID=A0A4V1Q207_9AGAR|nr:hypothetical protein EST38_g12424 [Candolleomyces aberdarensis]
MWNPTITDHFYTINVTEYEIFASTKGYLKDGIAGYVFAEPQPNTEALFRLWTPEFGDHFYTSSVFERNHVLKDGQYKDEGVACYLYMGTPEGQSCGQPLYRLHSPGYANHFYTGSQREKERMKSSEGYTSDEGITGWILPY